MEIPGCLLMSGGCVSPTTAFDYWEIVSSVDCLSDVLYRNPGNWLEYEDLQKAELHHQGENNLLLPKNPFIVCS